MFGGGGMERFLKVCFLTKRVPPRLSFLTKIILFFFFPRKDIIGSRIGSRKDILSKQIVSQ